MQDLHSVLGTVGLECGCNRVLCSEYARRYLADLDLAGLLNGFLDERLDGGQDLNRNPPNENSLLLYATAQFAEELVDRRSIWDPGKDVEIASLERFGVIDEGESAADGVAANNTRSFQLVDELKRPLDRGTGWFVSHLFACIRGVRVGRATSCRQERCWQIRLLDVEQHDAAAEVGDPRRLIRSARVDDEELPRR